MSVPGGLGGLNSVGAIYVSVLTDTSGMKGEIEDAARKAGVAGNRQFNKGWQEQQDKVADDLLFSKAVQARMKKSAKRFGKEFSQSLVTGIGDPKLNIDRMVSDDLSKIAEKFGKLPKDVKEQWEGQFRGILSRQIDQEIAKVEKNMGGAGRNIGDVLADGFEKSSFEVSLKKVLKRVTYDIKTGVVSSGEEIADRYGEVFERLSKTFNVPIVDIAGQVNRQLPAVQKEIERLAADQLKAQEKAQKASIALNEKLERARIASEEKVQRETLRLQEKTQKEAIRLQEKTEKETLRLKEKTAREAIRFEELVELETERLQEKAAREAQRLVDRVQRDRDREGSVFAQLFKVDRATLGLFRAGSPNSPFGALTGGFALVTGAANLAFRTISLFPKVLGLVGQGFIKLGGILGKFSATLGKIVGRFGGVIAALATNPFVLIGVGITALVAGTGVLIKGLGIVVAAFKAVVGIMTLFAGAAFYTAASMVIVASAAASLAIGLGVAKLGMSDTLTAVQALNKGLTTGDWDAYNEAMKKLGPNAQKAVKSLRPIFQALEDIRKPLAEKIFANVGTVISAASKQFGFMEEFLLGIGQAINDVIIRFAALGGNTFFVESVKTLMAAAIPIIVNFGRAAADVFAGIVNVLAIVAPLAIQFSEKVSSLAERFRLFTESAAGKTRIEGFFERAWIIANLVWDIIKKVGAAIFGVLGQTYETNSGPNGFLMKIQGTLDRLLTWITENPDSLKTWFGDAQSVAEGIWHAIEKVGEMIDLLDTPENMESLKNILSLIGNVAGALNGVIEAFETIYGWLNKNPNETTWAKFPRAAVPFGPGLQTPVPFGPGLPMTGVAPGQPTGVPTKGYWSNGKFIRARAAGGFVSRPELSWVGEAGPELVIPLKRPLHLIDPAARPVAKMLRDQRQPHSTGPQKVVNLTQNITPIQSDPKAVAASVVNRAVILARV